MTLSGGEATLWPDFCMEMLGLCHAHEIPVAIDTCGQVTTPEGLEVLHQADLILFDVKGLDSARHQANTGVGNGIIQENLSRLEQWGKDTIIRYPIIPNHNQGEAEAIATFLAGFTCIRRVDLIPYHPYGSGKYTQLGRDYPLEGLATIAEPEQQSLLALFCGKGLNAQLGG